jgi:potassium inwardly-rectifying channel subfamily J
MRTLGNNATDTSSRLFVFSKSAKIKRSMPKKSNHKRLLFKNGTMNVSRSNIDKRRRRYLTDIFTTLIDLKWRYNLGFFALGFFLSWTFFAMAWYFISYIHDDFNPKNMENPFYKPCIMNVTSFSGAMLFSIETQQTIGYGLRVTTEKCSEAILIVMVQSAIGVMLQSLMVGIVFAKLSRPKKRSETLMFSKNCVINLRDGRLCLMCRVADMRKSHIVEAHVRMYLIKKKVTLEGEIIPLHIYDLNVGWDKGINFCRYRLDTSFFN